LMKHLPPIPRLQNPYDLVALQEVYSPVAIEGRKNVAREDRLLDGHLPSLVDLGFHSKGKITRESHLLAVFQHLLLAPRSDVQYIPRIHK